MSWYLVGFIAVMTLATFLTRVLPFLIFRKGGDHPLIGYIGRYLPPAIMLLLVIYCMKGVNFAEAPHGAPELLASLAVIAVHLLWRNSLLSIGAGTALYMYMVQAGVLS